MQNNLNCFFSFSPRKNKAEFFGDYLFSQTISLFKPLAVDHSSRLQKPALCANAAAYLHTAQNKDRLAIHSEGTQVTSPERRKQPFRKLTKAPERIFVLEHTMVSLINGDHVAGLI